MANELIFLSENLLNNANVELTTGTENAQFPLENIKNESPSIFFRSIENNIVILIDFQQTRSIDSIGFVGTSVRTFGLTNASVKFSLTTDFSSFTALPVTLNAEYKMGYLFLNTPLSYRYAEITLTGNGSFCELSNLFIGKNIKFTEQSISIGSFGYGYRDKSTVSSNDYGQKFINKRNTVKYISGDLEYCNKDEQEIFDNLHIAHQRNKPLWMFVDQNSDGLNDGAYKLSIYGYMEDSPDWKAFGGQHYSAHIRIDEAV